MSERKDETGKRREYLLSIYLNLKNGESISEDNGHFDSIEEAREEYRNVLNFAYAGGMDMDIIESIYGAISDEHNTVEELKPSDFRPKLKNIK